MVEIVAEDTIVGVSLLKIFNNHLVTTLKVLRKKYKKSRMPSRLAERILLSIKILRNAYTSSYFFALVIATAVLSSYFFVDVVYRAAVLSYLQFF